MKKKNIDQFATEKQSPVNQPSLGRELMTELPQQFNDSKKDTPSELFSYMESKYKLIPTKGIFFQANPDKGETWLANPLVCMAKLMYQDERHRYGRRFSFMDAEGKEQAADIPIEWFAGDGAPVEKLLLTLGFPYKKGGIRSLLEYLSQVKPNASICIYDKAGWNNDCFVLPHKVIGGGAGHFIDDMEAAKYGNAGDFQNWQEACKLCETNSRLGIALLSAFAAPLLAMSGIASFGIHLAGQSSIGKTTALRIAASVFGNPKQYPLTWRATSNALESVAAAHNDTLLILDEIGQSSFDLDETIYMLFNEQSKKRMKKDCQLRKPQSWRMIVLSSGENTLEEHLEAAGKKSKAGQEARFIGLMAEVHPTT